jgi:hypothetical protein
LNLCAPNIQYLSELNYFAEDIVYVQVKVWDVSMYRNKNIKMPKYLKDQNRYFHSSSSSRIK